VLLPPPTAPCLAALPHRALINTATRQSAQAYLQKHVGAAQGLKLD
jgi:hypothetical protein